MRGKNDFSKVCHWVEKVREDHLAEKDRLIEETSCLRSHLLSTFEKRQGYYLELALSPSRSHLAADISLRRLAEEVSAYAARSTWNYIDLCLLLSCADSVPEPLIEQTVQSGIIYQAFRMVDDSLDGHRDYKGGYPTLWGVLETEGLAAQQASAVNLLSALLLLFLAVGKEGLLTDGVLNAARGTIEGAIQEALAPSPLELQQYLQIVRGKMVCYGMLLYGPALGQMDSGGDNGLSEFVGKSFLVSQMINDLLDRNDDLDRGQPNFWNLHAQAQDAIAHFLQDVSALEDLAGKAPARFQPYTRSRLVDLATYCGQILNLQE
jgi:hypothetical protein